MYTAKYGRRSNMRIRRVLVSYLLIQVYILISISQKLTLAMRREVAFNLDSSVYESCLCDEITMKRRKKKLSYEVVVFSSWRT